MAHIPHLNDRVSLPGRAGAFLVIAVYDDRQTVDLLPEEGVSYVVDGVPFSALSVFAGETGLLQPAW